MSFMRYFLLYCFALTIAAHSFSRESPAFKLYERKAIELPSTIQHLQGQERQEAIHKTVDDEFNAAHKARADSASRAEHLAKAYTFLYFDKELKPRQKREIGKHRDLFVEWAYRWKTDECLLHPPKPLTGREKHPQKEKQTAKLIEYSKTMAEWHEKMSKFHDKTWTHAEAHSDAAASQVNAGNAHNYCRMDFEDYKTDLQKGRIGRNPGLDCVTALQLSRKENSSRESRELATAKPRKELRMIGNSEFNEEMSDAWQADSDSGYSRFRKYTKSVLDHSKG